MAKTHSKGSGGVNHNPYSTKPNWGKAPEEDLPENSAVMVGEDAHHSKKGFLAHNHMGKGHLHHHMRRMQE